MTLAERYPQSKVRPLLYPVDEDSILSLERKRFLPEALKSFWRNHGSGFFNDAEDGSSIVEGAVNHLISPTEVEALIDADEAYDDREYADTLPIFEMNDYIYLVLDKGGAVVATDTGRAVVLANSIDEFVGLIMTDPGFYIPVLGAD